MTAFLRRYAAQGAAPQGLSAYGRQIRATLRIASTLAGSQMTPADLFQSEHLLGHSVIHDESKAPGVRLSKWTLAQRRAAVRKFAVLMRPELTRVVRDEPILVVDRALQAVAERVGTGYRLTGGAPRRRGGRAPSQGQIRDVLDAVGQASGYRAARNRAFFRILAETGSRVNALRKLDSADCIEMPNGRLRIFLHEKGKAEPREVELSRAAADGLRAYAEEFNYHAAVRRWSVRVRLGEPGPVWRNSARDCWAYHDVLATLRAGCVSAEVPAFTPHALRRAFATDAASILPRHTVAQAGGWQGLERLDDHYVQPRGATIREKLARHDAHDVVTAAAEDAARESTRSL